MQEIWKEIPNCAGYFISTVGNVRGPLGKNLSPRFGGYKKKYLRFSYRKTGPDIYIHRAMLLTFVGPAPTKKHQASHLNGNPKDNRLGNLRWETPLNNSQRKISHGTSGKGSKNTRSKLSEKDVEEIIEQYLKCIRSDVLAKKYGVCIGSIVGIVSRKNWKHVPVSKSKEKTLAIIRRGWILQGGFSGVRK